MWYSMIVKAMLFLEMVWVALRMIYVIICCVCGIIFCVLLSNIIVNGFYTVRSTKILQSWFLSQKKLKYLRWEMVAGVITGFSTSLISISFFKLLQQMISSFSRLCVVRMLPLAFHTVRIKRVCFLVAYFTVTGWLAVQYGKRIGLLEIFTAFIN